MRGVCLFGGHHRGYPRSTVIVNGLRRIGVPVTECVVSPRLKSPRRYPALVRAYRRITDPFDLVFVPEFRHKDMPLAWALSRLSGKTCVFDPLVSRYDTRVHDRRDVPAGGAQAWHNLNLDRVSMSLADLALADTGTHAAFFQSRLAAPDVPVRVLPVGYDDDVFRPAAQVEGTPVRVLFYGSYLPLHGVDVIVEAAARLRENGAIHIELIGGGQTFGDVEQRVRAAGLVNVTLTPRVDEADLCARIAGASICLGIFGSTDKAARVVPNKVYQCMGMNRAVITADTPAAREFFVPGRHVELVPPGNADALAAAIQALAVDDARRRALAEAAGEHVRANFSPVPIARRFVRLCEEVMA
ncbi:MAG TPA: glycosyltransferase [Candidatus Krumholzibacteria bacterium]|nr:glycosyltransferase [Candidatus Krumholzibacteria bacterium]